MNSIRNSIYELMDVVPHRHDSSKRFGPVDIFLMGLITLNVLAVILDTVQAFHASYGRLLYGFEVFSVAVFTIEYVLRVWSCTVNPGYRRSLVGRLRFIVTPLSLIDLLAILPFYLPMFIPFDLRFLRVIRLVRILRLFKLGRYNESVQQFGRVLKSKRAELLTTVFIIFILLIVASSLLYYVEHKAQPEKFASIPEAMWWGVVTLTTVGYGDIYPITGMGRFLGAIISLLGIGLFALPTGLISAGFVEEIGKKKRAQAKCPKCGTILEDMDKFQS